MNSEDLIDWHAIPGGEWYRPENVPKAIAGIRHCDLAAPDILYQIANNHCGEVFPAAVDATPILLEIAMNSDSQRAAMHALSVLDTLVWFRGAPPFNTVVHEDIEVTLDKAIRVQIEASRPQLMASANRDQIVRKSVLGLFESIQQQTAEK